MQLYHVVGDATQPVKSPAIIAHVCNDEGKWGSGFVLALGKAHPQAESEYHGLTPGRRVLGFTQFVVDGDVTIANMIAQHGVRPHHGIPLRYSSLNICLADVQNRALAEGRTVHMPRIGAKRGGGDWSVIKAIILATMKVDTYVYTLPAEANDWPETKVQVALGANTSSEAKGAL